MPQNKKPAPKKPAPKKPAPKEREKYLIVVSSTELTVTEAEDPDEVLELLTDMGKELGVTAHQMVKNDWAVVIRGTQSSSRVIPMGLVIEP